jgi:hypothetical protein
MGAGSFSLPWTTAVTVPWSSSLQATSLESESVFYAQGATSVD